MFSKRIIFFLNKWGMRKLSLTDAVIAEKNPLIDNHGRFHDYLRISLTERCNLRCLYCMPEEGVHLSPKSNILTADEIFKISSHFVKLGVRIIRFTGGEPLIRKDLVDIMGKINSLKDRGLEKIYISTNAITLSSKIDDLLKAGLNGINISLDTLIPSKYEQITRRKGYEKVWRSISDCLGKGLDSVKINCVVIRGINADEIINFVQLTENMPVDIRFIEYMPFGGNKWDLKKMVSYSEMLSIIKDHNIELTPVDNGTNSTSKMYRVKDWKGRVGFITSNTANFCSTCNRLRITADGNLKVCLHGLNEVNLRDLLRSANDDDKLTKVIEEAIMKKKSKHADLPSKRNILSHVDSNGNAQMVDVSHKSPTDREASASCFIQMNTETLTQIRNNTIQKGDVLTVAKIAGIQAVKRTDELIPLCHQLQLSKINIECELQMNGVLVTCTTIAASQKTGVEMESIIGATITAITIYDMCKAIDKEMIIQSVQVIHKSGGKQDICRNIYL